MALTLSIIVDRILCIFNWAAPSALVSVAVAAEGAGHIGQVESSLSRLAFVLFKVLLTRCLHAL